MIYQFNTYLFNINIYSNVESGEIISFEFYTSEIVFGSILSSTQSIEFTDGMSIGGPNDPTDPDACDPVLDEGCETSYSWTAEGGFVTDYCECINIPGGECDCNSLCEDGTDCIDNLCTDGTDCTAHFEDECGVCNGDGIDEGACNCAGDIDDCAGVCGGGAVVDECGECNGDGIDEGACNCAGDIDESPVPPPS